MTPAIKLLEKHCITHTVHDYDHDPKTESYGNEAVTALGVSDSRVFKTLMVQLSSGDLAVAVVPVSGQLNLKSMAKASGEKKANMADPKDVERSSGYILGGVSPLAQRKRLTTVIDESATAHETIYISAGRRGLEIELSANDLLEQTNAKFANIRG